MTQREQILLEQRQRIIKQSDKKIWVKFQKNINNEVAHFKIWIECSNNKQTDVEDILTTIAKLYPASDIQLNNNNYHLLVDDMYENLAKSYPDTNIWIEVNNNDIGILAKYETRAPSTFLKI